MASPLDEMAINRELPSFSTLQPCNSVHRKSRRFVTQNHDTEQQYDDVAKPIES